jgi:hypothetical protein
MPGVGVALPAHAVEKCPVYRDVLERPAVSVERNEDLARHGHDFAPGIGPDADLVDDLAHPGRPLQGLLRVFVLERVGDRRQLFALREVIRKDSPRYKRNNAGTTKKIVNQSFVEISQCSPCTSVVVRDCVR